MKTCPECDGRKEHKISSSNPLNVYSDKPTVYDVFECDTCKGTGQVSELQFAIYKARGGQAPPIQQKGYA